MKFCLVTTFYPPYHFGGDAVFVAHLAAELGRRGHTVDVVHDVDAFRLLSPQSAPTPASPPTPPNVTVHALSSPFGWWSPLVTHQTGRPWLNPALRGLLETGGHDVIHFHNASLIGAGAFSFGRGVKLYTMHEQWLVCPLHLLWKFGSRVCDGPECLRCSLLAGRPPQWWRYTSFFRRQLGEIDRFLAPNQFVLDLHRSRGMDLPLTELRNFVPATWLDEDGAPNPRPRPYFLFSGRLTAVKGLQTVLPAFRGRRDIDLVIAGDGDQAETLRASVEGLANIVFLGQVEAETLRALYRHAIALIVPSLVYEVGPLVAFEAFCQGTPVIARDMGGLADVVLESGGGVLYRSDDDLNVALDRFSGEPAFRDELGQRGFAKVRGPWSADAHMTRYLEIVDECARTRAGRAGV